MLGTPFEKNAIDNISFEIEKGEFIAVIGHTGCGKSTMIQHLNGLLKPSKGKILIDGIDINTKDKKQKEAIKKIKNKVGMVFQYPEHQLFAETIYEDVAFGPRNKGFNEEEVDLSVREALEHVGLNFEEFAKRSPFQLSGGQMRRVAIAGVIAMQPEYLILDEPSAGLDPKSRDMIFKEIIDLYTNKKMAVILVTHSMDEAAQYAERILVMNNGNLIIDDKTKNVFENKRATLKEVGVDIPNTVKLADALRAKNMPIEKDTMKKVEIVNQIKKAKGWSEC
jgi:energy-coupling factor transport system ATP-binding protein